MESIGAYCLVFLNLKAHPIDRLMELKRFPLLVLYNLLLIHRSGTHKFRVYSRPNTYTNAIDDKNKNPDCLTRDREGIHHQLWHYLFVLFIWFINHIAYLSKSLTIHPYARHRDELG